MMEWAVSSCFLLAASLLLRQIFKGQVSPRLQYALWVVVLLRLLLPFNLGSTPISVMNSVERIPAVQNVTSIQDVTGLSQMEDGSVVGYNHSRTEELPIAVAPAQSAEAFTRLEQTMDFRNGVRLAWKIGVSMMLLVLVASNARFAWRLWRKRERVQQDNFPLPVYTAAVDTPCMFGVFRPAVYVTEEIAADEQTLHHALTHEYTHFQQGDQVWSVLRGVALSLHWYNPLTWWAAFLSKQDAELSCDAGTVRRLGETERVAYGRTLVRLTCEKRIVNPLAVATAMTGSGKSIRERITVLVKRPKNMAAVLATVLAMTTLFAGCTFTGAQNDPADGSESLVLKDRDAKLFQCGDLTVALPKEIMSKLTVEVGDGEEDGALLHVSEKKSIDAAKADNLENPEEYGWMYSLCRYDTGEFEQNLIGELGNVTYIAKDDQYYYGIVGPTDVWYYRENDQYPNETEMEECRWLNEVVYHTLAQDFPARNQLPYYDTNSLRDGTMPYFSGERRYVRATLPGQPEEEIVLTLSQPAKKGDDGIWCVEYFTYTAGYGGSFWFPQKSGTAADYYAEVQKRADRGEKTAYADLLTAAKTFFAEAPFFQDEDVTQRQFEVLPPLPSVAELLNGLKADDLQESPEWPDQEKLVRCLQEAAPELMEGALPQDFGHDAWNGQIAFQGDEEMELWLYCGPDSSETTLRLQKGPMVQTAVSRSKDLYELVQTHREQPEKVDKTAYQQYKDLLEPVMQEALRNLRELGYTDVSCDRLELAHEYQAADGSAVQLYAFDFSLIPEKGNQILPMSIDRNAYLTKDRRLKGIDERQILAVRQRDGKETAVLLPTAANRASQPETKVLAAWMLDWAEHPEGSVIRAKELKDGNEKIWVDTFRNDCFVDTENGAEIVFHASQRVENVKYFQVEMDQDGTPYQSASEPLYTFPEALTPDRLFSVRMALPEDAPTRGISYELDGIIYAYAICRNAVDGSISLEEMALG